MNSVQKTCLAILILAFSTPASIVAWESNQEDERSSEEKFVLVITLNASRIRSLQVDGVLKTEVPPKLRNKIEAIRFQNPTSFLDEPIQIEAKTDLQNRALASRIDQSVIDRLEYQPVQMKIYDGNFSSVLVVLDNSKQDSVATVPGQLAAPPQGPNDSNPFFVRISDTRGISGAIKDLKTIVLKTEFGDVDLPFEHVRGIRFRPIENSQTAQVYAVLKNGDRISGVVNRKTISIKSRWGEKELRIAEIDSLTLTPGEFFVTDPDDKIRWRLTRGSESLMPAGNRIPK